MSESVGRYVQPQWVKRNRTANPVINNFAKILATAGVLFREESLKWNLDIMPLWLFHCIGVSVLGDRKMSDFFKPYDRGMFEM